MSSNTVKTIGFIATENVSDDEKLPLPHDYMIDSPLPQTLIDDIRENAWLSKDNIVCFADDYAPAPARDENGDVVLLVSNAELVRSSSDELDEAKSNFHVRLMQAAAMLHDDLRIH
jgi:hypothetical protein